MHAGIQSGEWGKTGGLDPPPGKSQRGICLWTSWKITKGNMFMDLLENPKAIVSLDGMPNWWPAMCTGYRFSLMYGPALSPLC